MKYLWTEDGGAGLQFWKLVNQYLFQGELIIESKGSNQGILDAVRELEPTEDDIYYIAFDKVYDNMDVVNKLLELNQLIAKYPKQIILMDITCFEHIILAFEQLVLWTGKGHRDVIVMREHVLKALTNHRINLDRITDEKTRNYLMGFKRYSTERVIKSITYMLTDGDAWSVRGQNFGGCWCKDCCVLERPEKKQCSLLNMRGKEKMLELLSSAEFQRIIQDVRSS